jgi:hypothetical protein
MHKLREYLSIVVVVHVGGAGNKNVAAAVEALRKDKMKLNLSPKLVEKTHLGPQLFCFVKF